jgi:hypothetical protein
MTEPEWEECTLLKPMAELLDFPHVDKRRRWLFACACCRRIWSLMEDERSRRLIELREGNDLGLVSEEELCEAIDGASCARNEARAPFRSIPDFDAHSSEAAPAWAAAAASTNSATAVHFVLNAASCVAGEGWKTGRKQEEAALCALLRDIFGNPFRSVSINPRWRTPTVTSLAEAAYLERQLPSGELHPTRLAVLADALEEADADASLLDHLRGPGPHVRGCWVVDCLTGRE